MTARPQFRKGKKVYIPSLKCNGKVGKEGIDSSGSLMYAVITIMGDIWNLAWYYPSQLEKAKRKKK